jgi:hypothetical protein
LEFTGFKVGMSTRSLGTAREKVHLDNSFSHCPKPVVFGHPRLDKESSGHGCSGLPLEFNRAVLGLLPRRGGTNLDAFVEKESVGVSFYKAGVEVAPDPFGDSPSVDEE